MLSTASSTPTAEVPAELPGWLVAGVFLEIHGNSFFDCYYMKERTSLIFLSRRIF
jgi:hypothetical protein